MPRRKSKTKKKQTKKNRKKQDLTWTVVGLVLLFLALSCFFQFGILGKELTNSARFLVGDSYLLFAGILGIFGLVMLIYNQPPHLGFKRSCGLLLAYCGLILLLAGFWFDQKAVHSDFLPAFFYAIHSEFAKAAVTSNVGGGILAAAAYQLGYDFLGQIGIRIIAILLMPIGLLMFFNVKYRTVIELFQTGSQKVIAENKKAGSKLKNKYQAHVQENDNRKKLRDPLAGDEDLFGDEAIEDKAAASAAPAPEKQAELEIKTADPELQTSFYPDAEPTAAKTETAEPAQSAALPKAHAEADEDQQLLNKYADIDHGELNTAAKTSSNYQKPPLKLLDPVKNVDQSQDQALIKQNTQVLKSTFASFGVKVLIKRAILGPTVTRYEVQPAVGVKVSRIVNLADDLALALAAKDIRIEAPIPGKPFIGIEVPNRVGSVVSFKDVMARQTNRQKRNPMVVPLGKDVSGQVVSCDLRKMPHLLIAGSTGSGKSVAINTILTSILMKARPEAVKLVLIDPKMVELSVYNGVPHLLIPVVTDAKLAANALHKTVKEMERRYKLFASGGARNIDEYNAKVAQNNQDKSRPVMTALPYIVIVVDELSDLMMVGGHEVEDAIVRLGQMARAAGIHMILATQRPSVDVITGLIKANVPSRISFAVSSGVDSRTILDQTGAEKLLGHGDMLYDPIGASKPERLQGAFIHSDEVERVVSWVKKQQTADYNQEMMPQKHSEQDAAQDEPEDEFYQPAVDLVRRQQAASVSMLQRRFRIGYNRAARIVDAMEAKGIVGPSEGSKPRQVLMPPPTKNEGKSNHDPDQH
jgi:S-DNA-T family DNA segregation ATPase FtsK/SpoIIIE